MQERSQQRNRNKVRPQSSEGGKPEGMLRQSIQSSQTFQKIQCKILNIIKDIAPAGLQMKGGAIALKKQT